MDLREESQMTPTEEMNHWWIRTRFFYLEKAIASMNPGSKSVLEVGSGTGQNLRFLLNESSRRADFARLVGYEPGLSSVAQPLESEDLSLEWISDFGSLQEGQKFDFLLAMDVLEHIEDDRSALDTWLSKMNPGALVFLTVPAFRSLWSYHDEKLGHQRRYKKSELIRLAQNVGLKTVWTTYAFSYLFPVAYLVRKVFGSGKESSDTDLKPSPGVVNIPLKVLGKMEAAVGGCPMWGTSVVGLFQLPSKKV